MTDIYLLIKVVEVVGKRAEGKRNHKAGILVSGPNIIKEPLQHFDSIWKNQDETYRSHWKRFEAKAKEFEKLRG